MTRFPRTVALPHQSRPLEDGIWLRSHGVNRAQICLTSLSGLGISSQSEAAYTDIHQKWASARQRRDEFIQECSHLPHKIGGIEIVVRPLLGRYPPRLELLIKIPEGLKATHLRNSVNDIVSWRECLTNFQGPRALLGIESLARFEKQSDGRFKFIHAEPLTISNALNRKFASLLETSEFHRNDSPPADPPFNSIWCLEEAYELLRCWNIQFPERWITKGLNKIRSGEQVLETRYARNGIETVIGPFTCAVIDKKLRAWRRHRQPSPPYGTRRS